jgi:hypothetical protein
MWILCLFFTTVPSNPIPLDALNAANLRWIIQTPKCTIRCLNEVKPRFATLAAIQSNPLLIIDETLVPRAAAIKQHWRTDLWVNFAGLIGDIFLVKHDNASNVVRKYIYYLLHSGCSWKTCKWFGSNTTVVVPPFSPFNALGVSYHYKIDMF